MTSMRQKIRGWFLLTAVLCAGAGQFLIAADQPKDAAPESAGPAFNAGENSRFQTDPALPAGVEDRTKAAGDDESRRDLTGKGSADAKSNKSKNPKLKSKKLLGNGKEKKRGKFSIHPQLDKAFSRAMQVQERNTGRLLAQKGIRGTGLGLGKDGQPAIRVFLTGQDKPNVPPMLEGVPVEAVKSGICYSFSNRVRGVKIVPSPARPKPAVQIGKGWGGGKSSPGLKPTGKTPGKKVVPLDNQFPTDYWDRPVPIGITAAPVVSVCYGGTLGCRITLRSDTGSVYALSNNHVFANENNATNGSTVISQPSPLDNFVCGNGNLTNRVGVLANFIPMSFDGVTPNLVDAAIAKMDEGTLGFATPRDGYGSPLQTPRAAVIGDLVMKYGRTTGFTAGTVIGLNVTSLVGYDEGDALFVNQIEIAPLEPDYFYFGLPGDSGSLIVQRDHSPTALLFAGDFSTILGNPIQTVLDALDLEFPSPPDGGEESRETPGKRGRASD